MLEPTEPTEGSELNTPSDTLPPRRRRRAASRPAGSPVAAAAEAPDEVTPAIPAAEDAAEEPTVTAEADQTEAAEEADRIEESLSLIHI